MVRSMVLALLLAPVLSTLIVLYARSGRRGPEQLDEGELSSRRQLALDRHIQENARSNYDLLDRFVRITEIQLAEDAMVGSSLSLLSEERRAEAQELVDEFYRQQKRGCG